MAEDGEGCEATHSHVQYLLHLIDRALLADYRALLVGSCFLAEGGEGCEATHSHVQYLRNTFPCAILASFERSYGSFGRLEDCVLFVLKRLLW